MSAQITATQITSGIMVIKALAEAIREAKQIPSGHLYAAVMGQMDLPRFLQIVDILKRGGLVEEKYNLLIWKGPEV